jgi:hypothetical protein
MSTETLWLYGKDGSKHRAYITQERIDTSTFSGSSSIPGFKTAKLQDGTSLNVIDENTFKNVFTDELLYRNPVKE